MFCPMSAITGKKHHKDFSHPLCCFEALDFDICCLSTLVQILVYVVIVLWIPNVLQIKMWWACAPNCSWDRDSGCCCLATGRFRACRLAVEWKYGQLSRETSAWPVIPLYGLEARRRKWIILPRGAVPNWDVAGVPCACQSSVGLAGRFWRSPHTNHTGSAKTIL